MSLNHVQKATGASPAGLTDSLIFDNGTNVGVGTSTPVDNLHIRTSANQHGLFIDGSSSNAAGDHILLTLKNNAAGGVEWNIDSSGGTAGVGQGKLSFQVAKKEHIAPFVLVSTGNVGIGTLEPLSRLDVRGGVAVGSYAGSTAAPNNGLIVSGNVGIGTTTPEQLLDVNGPAAVGSLVPHSGNLVLNSNLSSKVLLQINGTTGATLNGKGFGIGSEVQSDAVGQGATVISNGYMGINTDFWMRPSQAGSVANCSPFAATAGANYITAQFWQESTFGAASPATICAIALNGDGGVSTNQRIGFLATVGNSRAGNYPFVGQDYNGGAVGNVHTVFVVDNIGGAAFGPHAAGALALMGAGTINVSGGIYRNGRAYNHPDYVFEHHRTGKIERFADNEGASEYRGLQALSDVENFVRAHDALPLMDLHRDGDLFRRGNLLMATVEEAYLYLFQLHHRLSAVERELIVAAQS